MHCHVAKQDATAIILVARPPLLHRIVDRSVVIYNGGFAPVGAPDLPAQLFAGAPAAGTSAVQFSSNYSSLAELNA